MVVGSPNPAWVKTLPNGKLPDRSDFQRYGDDTKSRVVAWSRALQESQRLADEFAAWAQGGSGLQAQPLV